MCAKLERKRVKEKQGRLSFVDDLLYKLAPKPPVKEGDVLKVKVTETTIDKVGVARIGLFKISIPNTNLGEEIKIRIKAVSEEEALGEKIG